MLQTRRVPPRLGQESRWREIQSKRFPRYNFNVNAEMRPRDLMNHYRVDDHGNELLKNAFSNLGLSARGYDRILKVARTIADLDGSERIGAAHVAEAIQYRSLERKYH